MLTPTLGEDQGSQRSGDASTLREVSLADLSTDYSPRQTRVDYSHVAALMEVVDRLPPIVVHERTMTVIDGVHRVEAHRRVGRSHMQAFFFTGTELEALVMAVEANVKHGKPLSRGERQAAARVFLTSCPDRSDRWVADVCGLSHTTVAALRRALSLAGPQMRTGRDGRRRPVDPLPGRVAVARAIADNPSTTVRQAARAAGVAPSTARRIVAALNGSGDVSPAPKLPIAPPALDVEEAPTLDLRAETSAELTEAASWWARTAVSLEDLHNRLGDVPLSRVYEVADECRRRARSWSEIANALEMRARGGRSHVRSAHL
jgi:ParB-like chromosome segregation protein Spo0J